jgi:hypothetical protein
MQREARLQRAGLFQGFRAGFHVRVVPVRSAAKLL